MNLQAFRQFVFHGSPLRHTYLLGAGYIAAPLAVAALRSASKKKPKPERPKSHNCLSDLPLLSF